MASTTWRLGQLINSAQSTFVGLLRLWSIPIVLMLSVASGYTTYHGMTYFITWWIALIITIAVQSILVISSLELAGIHWRANRTRYLMVTSSLLVAVTVSVSFSYFKFYEISRKETLQIQRLSSLQDNIQRYLDEINQVKSQLVTSQQARIEKAQQDATAAFLGTLPGITDQERKRVGKGTLWQHYQTLLTEEQGHLREIEEGFSSLGFPVRELRETIYSFKATPAGDPSIYQSAIQHYQHVQALLSELATTWGRRPPEAPAMLPYEQFVQGIEPSFAIWNDFSWFAFACAAMVDFFTLLLSYRLEFTAPGPLTPQERELAYACFKEFNDVKVNRNDELELSVEKTDIERARRYSDRTRLFGAAFLLSRGYLRKVDNRSVEFAPNLYPVIADQMRQEQGDKEDQEART
jgi:hypothetical protein